MDNNKNDVCCSNCGYKNDVNDKFCTRCGNIIVERNEVINDDNKVDDGEKDAIKSLRYFSLYFLYIMLCINAFIESKNLSDSNAVGYGFLIVFGGFFVIFPTLFSCILGCSAVSKYNKCGNIKSSSRKKLNTLNIISLILMGLFFMAIILSFLVLYIERRAMFV